MTCGCPPSKCGSARPNTFARMAVGLPCRFADTVLGVSSGRGHAVLSVHRPQRQVGSSLQGALLCSGMTEPVWSHAPDRTLWLQLPSRGVASAAVALMGLAWASVGGALLLATEYLESSAAKCVRRVTITAGCWHRVALRRGQSPSVKALSRPP